MRFTIDYVIHISRLLKIERLIGSRMVHDILVKGESYDS